MTRQKFIYLGFVGVILIFSLLGWHSLKDLLFDAPAEKNILFVVIVFLLLAGFAGTTIVLFDSFGWLILIFGLCIAPLVVFFSFEPIYLAALALGIGFLASALAEAIKEKRVHLKVMAVEIARPALRMFFLVLVMIVALTLYFSPPAQGLAVDIKIPRPLFDLILNATIGFLGGQIEGQTNQIFSLPLGIGNLSGFGASDIKNVMAGQNFQIDKVLDQETKDELYETVNGQINFFVKPYKKYLPYGLAVAVFLSLNALKFIFIGIAGLLSHLIFSIMKTLKLVRIKKEMVEREITEI